MPTPCACSRLPEVSVHGVAGVMVAVAATAGRATAAEATTPRAVRATADRMRPSRVRTVPPKGGGTPARCRNLNLAVAANRFDAERRTVVDRLSSDRHRYSDLLPEGVGRGGIHRDALLG